MSEKKAVKKTKKKKRILQTDVPGSSLDQAIRIAHAIADNYASKPTSPLNVAAAIEMSPSSGPFRSLCGASIAYGLTDGGYNAKTIEITALGSRIVRPLEEGDDLLAKREAILKPRVLGEFLRRYDNSPLPKDEIAINVLEELGVPRDRGTEVLQLILDSGESVGFFKSIKNKKYIDLSGVPIYEMPSAEDVTDSDQVDQLDREEKPPTPPHSDAATPSEIAHRKKRVFITHGKNKALLDPIKKLLSFGELEPVISVEKQTVSKPVPEKVMSDMRSCGAAIIHVDADKILLDQETNEHIVLNENVLIEIGAAMALYGRRYVLLVKEGVQLPSNLQGLFEVRYVEDALDGNATIKLLEAINDIKNHPLPDETSSTE